MAEKVKILKVREKEFDDFTAFNLMVDLDGKEEWINGYLGDENRDWREGDLVEVEIWENDEGYLKYKPAGQSDDSRDRSSGSRSRRGGNSRGRSRSSGRSRNRREDPPPDRNGEEVSNREIKSLIIRTGKKIAEIDERISEMEKKTDDLRDLLGKLTLHMDRDKPEDVKKKESPRRDNIPPAGSRKSLPDPGGPPMPQGKSLGSDTDLSSLDDMDDDLPF